MAEGSADFHNIALKSILFKGRSDWYFCYLKAEKIAHVLTLLARSSPQKDSDSLHELALSAGRLPHMIAHFVAGEVEGAVVLADVFSLLSLVRLSATQGCLAPENSFILVEEYENIVRRIAAEHHPSPFITSQDFVVEEAPQQDRLEVRDSLPRAFVPRPDIKDTNKGLQKDTRGESKGQDERTALIFNFVKANKGVSIKEIAAVVRGCSEKTIQRELANLIRQGLVQRQGEKRWSLYLPAPSLR